MSEEHTRNLPGPRSFEERVFARFDALDAGMARTESRLENVETQIGDLNARVGRLEAESERRAADTKPIWERALAEIVDVKEEVSVIRRKVDSIELKLDVVASDLLDLRADQRQLRKRMDKLDSEAAR